MCGIIGYISLDNSFGETDLSLASCTIKHRGPDAEGFYFSDDKKIGLAHRRLSILDLSSSANQPMFSADKRYVIIYNGEVYNFKELKEKLYEKGNALITTSDTEVILALFAEYGVKSFQWLNGMFAFVILDTVDNVITICRDQAGIKPLFIYADKGNLIFSSELKGIKSIKKKDLAIDRSVIPCFLHLGFIPQPDTIYKEVQKFPSAHYLQIDTTTKDLSKVLSNSKPFWNLEENIKASAIDNEAKAKKELTNLLFDSVERQLISDVPVGTFLSGGVDSSLVTAIASKVSNQKINTFSIAVDEGRFNESKYALQVASHLNTNHHEFIVKEQEVLELLNTFLPTYDEPFADTSAFPTIMVSRLARKHVTVALSGDGGDELFMGYGSAAWAKRLSHPAIPFIRKPLQTASKLMNDKYQRAGNLFDYASKENIVSHIFSQEQYLFKENELKNILVYPHFSFDKINDKSDTSRKLTSEEDQSLWDFNYYLKDDLLVKVDRASMQNSLEVRVPLLDYRIVEFAFNLSTELKIKNGIPKYLLKQILYDHVPAEIFNRPKMGFSIPLNKWLKTDLRYLMEKYLSKEIIEKFNVVKFKSVEKLMKDYLKGKDFLYNRLWVIIVLHWWLEENEI